MKKRIYVIENGKIIRKDNSLIFQNSNNTITYIPIYQIENIFVFGHLEFNKDVISLLFNYNISILFFSFYGKFIGSFRPNHDYLGKCLLNQVNIINNEELKNLYIKEIISTSICNMCSVLKYYNKKNDNLYKEIEELDNLLNKLLLSKKDFLIFEATAKQTYYTSFNKIIKNNDFQFLKRTTNPPKDYINAIMSYGYAILYGLISTDIYQSNLVISLPFIHGITRSSTGLQYDIADIFKPVIIDRLIFRLINKKQINKTHFIIKENQTLLSKEVTKLFLDELENTLNSTLTVNNKNISYRSLLKREVYKIEKSVLNKSKYSGYLMRW